MADNYLEKRQEELAQGRRKVVKRYANPPLDTLLHRNRSYRGYDPSRIVTEEELHALVAVTALTAPGTKRPPTCAISARTASTTFRNSPLRSC